MRHHPPRPEPTEAPPAAKIEKPKAAESRLYEADSSVSAWVLSHQATHAIKQISKNDPNALAAIEHIRVVLNQQLQVITEGNRQ